MKKRVDITAQTKQNIIDAFWLLYLEKRIETITVKEIASKAGYNRGTFYEYFQDVYAVLEEIEQGLIPTIDTLPPISTPSASFGMPIDAFMTLFEQNAIYYAVLLGDKGDPAFATKLKNAIKPTIIKAFTANPDNDEKQMVYVVEYALSAMIGIMVFSFKQKDAISNKVLFDLIHQLMKNGVISFL